MLTPERFIGLAMENPVNQQLLARLPALEIPGCFLTAGCLFQVIWNARSGYAPDFGIKDYDIFYFDDRDISWEAEDAVIQRIKLATADLGVAIEVKNQARVHLWYERRFGFPYPRLTSTENGIDRFLIRCTCIAIDVATGRLYAPNGLEELERGLLGRNPANGSKDRFEEKAAAYRVRWPWLAVEPWGES